MLPDQPTPEVSDADVERVVRRDYAPAHVDTVLALVAEVEVREQPRVVLACLKIAAGNLDRLRGELANASGWYREQISEAEYPLASKRWSRIYSLPEDEVRAIFDKDWKQYSAWLSRP